MSKAFYGTEAISSEGVGIRLSLFSVNIRGHILISIRVSGDGLKEEVGGHFADENEICLEDWYVVFPRRLTAVPRQGGGNGVYGLKILQESRVIGVCVPALQAHSYFRGVQKGH